MGPKKTGILFFLNMNPFLDFITELSSKEKKKMSMKGHFEGNDKKFK